MPRSLTRILLVQALVSPARAWTGNRRKQYRIINHVTRCFSTEFQLEEGVNAYDACWSYDSRQANPHKDTRIDKVLQGLKSPSPQGYYVIQRALTLLEDPIAAFDQCSHLLKDGFHFHIHRDCANADLIPGIDWTIARESDLEFQANLDWEIYRPKTELLSALQLSHEILECVVDASEEQYPIPVDEINALFTQLTNRLDITLGTDVRGRSSSDTSFNLAMAGISENDVFHKLLETSMQEIKRTHGRKKNAKDIISIVERLAGSGIVGPRVEDLYRLAFSAKSVQGANFDALKEDPHTFNLLFPRALMCLWRFSARQSKIREKRRDLDFPGNEMLAEIKYDHDWINRLQDTTKDLVVDIGCGFGLSLLGLASLQDQPAGYFDFDLSNCNFVGGDLSQLGTRFGQGIAKRWNLNDRLQFCYSSGESLLDVVENKYTGDVAMILIQFPSPYRLVEDGNAQLPSGTESGFMVNRDLIIQVHRILSKSKTGILIVQSNCEDVAVFISKLAEENGFEAISAANPLTEADLTKPTKRTLRWIEMGGERAVGDKWSASPLLPPRCRTETEVSCELTEKPLHRFSMRIKHKEKK